MTDVLLASRLNDLAVAHDRNAVCHRQCFGLNVRDVQCCHAKTLNKFAQCATRLPDLRSVFIDTFRSLSNDSWVGDVPGGDEFEFGPYVLFDVAIDLHPIEYPAFLEMFATV